MENKNLKFLLLFIVVIVSFNLTAAPAKSGKVQNFYINSNGSVLFKVGPEIQSECGGGNLWDYSFAINSIAGQGWVSMLLAARTAKLDIIVGYAPNSNGYCSVVYLYHVGPN